MSGAKDGGRVADVRTFKPYPAYKNSGVEWLGRIPTHWNGARLKYLAALNPESLREDADSELEMVYVDIGGVDNLGRIIEKEPLTFGSAPTRARRLVRHGDVIVSTVRTYLRAIASVTDPEPNLVVSTGFAVVRPNEALTSEYAAYALRAPYFVERVVANSKGVSFPAINETEMATYRIALPSSPEQGAIAAFLDRETAKIDALVVKKERLIELLQEQRTALITRAVTKGLDPGGPMKHSGVEWLGEIPAHWEIARIKRHLLKIEQGWSPLAESRVAEADEWAVLKVGCVNGGRFDESENKALPAGVDPILEFEVHDGDLLVSRANTRELLGSAAIVTHVRPRLLLCDKLYRLSTDSRSLLANFLVAALAADSVRYQLEVEATGASNSMQNISQGTLRHVTLAIPPREEQVKILAHVDRETVKIEALVAKVGEAINRLMELRIALISAAVTGKIDVRSLG